MKLRLVRAGLPFVLTTSLALSACAPADVGASRLKELRDNTPRDSVLMVMGTGPLTAAGPDSMRVTNGFRRERYVIGGATYEVLYFREQPGTVREEVERELETPVVLKDGRYLGHGWKFYLRLAEEMKLPNPLLRPAN